MTQRREIETSFPSLSSSIVKPASWQIDNEEGFTRKAKKTRLKLSRTIERLFNILIGSNSVQDGYIFGRKRKLREYLMERKGGKDEAKRKMERRIDETRRIIPSNRPKFEHGSVCILNKWNCRR